MFEKPMIAAILAAALALAGAAHGAPLDWTKYADTETIEVISTDEDGGSRLTTIWIVVLDGQAYIRTAGTTWGDNVEREGTLKLREIGGDRAGARREGAERRRDRARGGRRSARSTARPTR